MGPAIVRWDGVEENLEGEVGMGHFDAAFVSVGQEGEAGLDLPPGLQGAHPYPQLPQHPLLLHITCRTTSHTRASQPMLHTTLACLHMHALADMDGQLGPRF